MYIFLATSGIRAAMNTSYTVIYNLIKQYFTISIKMEDVFLSLDGRIMYYYVLHLQHSLSSSTVYIYNIVYI